MRILSHHTSRLPLMALHLPVMSLPLVLLLQSKELALLLPLPRLLGLSGMRVSRRGLLKGTFMGIDVPLTYWRILGIRKEGTTLQQWSLGPERICPRLCLFPAPALFLGDLISLRSLLPPLRRILRRVLS